MINWFLKRSLLEMASSVSETAEHGGPIGIFLQEFDE